MTLRIEENKKMSRQEYRGYKKRKGDNGRLAFEGCFSLTV